MKKTVELTSTQVEDEHCDHLLDLAIRSLDKSYAPHSEFHVGCAGEFEDSSLFSGSNQENASYPSGLCAERVALFHANHQFPNKTVKRLFITAKSNRYKVPELLVPCAACLQVMAEVEQRQQSPIEILLYNPENNDLKKAQGVGQFLPFHFVLTRK